MTTELVRAEIRRFLNSSEPEILCLRGKWGVGKTYAWMQYIAEEASRKSIGLKRYSYVSLFGMNNLGDLRYAIFEGTVSEERIAVGPGVDSLKDLISNSESFGRKSTSIIAPLLNFFGASGGEDAVSRALFFSVRNQIICIDDLERAGSNLDLKDVLGLSSLLKDQRKCKVVILLNDKELGEGKKAEFEKLLEKVMDVSLLFDPSPSEAADIALEKNKAFNEIVKSQVIKMGVNNIRIIKKIERFSAIIGGMLSGFRDDVVESAIKTTAIAGWSVMAPDYAPSVDFLRKFNRDVESLRSQREGPDEHKRWAAELESLGYKITDDLDCAIIDGVSAGFFNEKEVIRTAREIQSHLENDSRNSSFSKAWDKYHYSLTEDDDEILSGMYNSSLENLKIISLANINGTVNLLREFNRDEEASRLVEAYMQVHRFGPGALDEELRRWGEENIDAEIEAAFKKIDDEYVDTRDPVEVLKQISKNRGWNEDDITLLSTQTEEDFERIFESMKALTCLDPLSLSSV